MLTSSVVSGVGTCSIDLRDDHADVVRSTAEIGQVDQCFGRPLRGACNAASTPISSSSIGPLSPSLQIRKVSPVSAE